MYHVLFYQHVDRVPALDEVSELTISVHHSSLAGFENVHLLGNRPVLENDLVGFHEYLKQTDFKRYAAETGRPIEELLTKASLTMIEGNRLKDSGDALAAIKSYTEAVDHFPLYFEAIDNRAFARMDLGDWDEAIVDLLESERINGPTMLTVFSIGECHLKAGRFTEARIQFIKCLERAPRNLLYQRFLQMAIDEKKPG